MFVAEGDSGYKVMGSSLDALSAFTCAFCWKETLFFVPAFAKAFLQPLVYLANVLLFRYARDLGL